MLKISKSSVRSKVGLKRLPSKFRMLVDGGWLFLLLKANGLHEKFHLWNMRYWVRLRSLDTRHFAINWRVDK